MSQDRSAINGLKDKIRKNGINPQEIKVVVSPLRICPLGAHIDHQDGIVTGMAIDRAIYFAFVPRSDNKVLVESLNFPGKIEFALDVIPSKKEGDWGNYIRGAALAVKQKYDIKTGLTGVIEGSTPIGGLSSSAAVGVAYLLALEAVNNLNIDVFENIQLDRYIENTYLGLKNGILDQSIILTSEPDKLTCLDCQNVEFEKIPNNFKNDFEIVIAYSGLSKALIDSSDYNNRVKECQEATKMLLEYERKEIPENPKLRMVSPETWKKYGKKLHEKLQKRAKHFFTEMERVIQGKKAWREGDINTFGDLINASGESSIYNYESGCPHLITLYEILKDSKGVYGTRFSGAGFRGCCIGIIDPKYKNEIKENIDEIYPKKHPDMAGNYSVHFCKASGAAKILVDL